MHAQGQIDLPEKDVAILWTRPHSPVFKTAMQAPAAEAFRLAEFHYSAVTTRLEAPFHNGWFFLLELFPPSFPGAQPTEHAPIANLLLFFLLHRGTAMPISDTLPSLLSKINENQLDLGAAIMELPPASRNLISLHSTPQL